MRDKLNLVRANLLCMLSMLVWAVALPAADLLIASVPPLLLTAARMALASACLLPLWWCLEGGAALRNAVVSDPAQFDRIALLSKTMAPMRVMAGQILRQLAR